MKRKRSFMKVLAVLAAVGATLVAVVSAQAQLHLKNSCGPLRFRVRVHSDGSTSAAVELCSKRYFHTVVYVNGHRLTYTQVHNFHGGFNLYAYGMETVVSVNDDQGTVSATGMSLLGAGPYAPHARVILNARN